MLAEFAEPIDYLACFRLELTITNQAIPLVVHICENAIKGITSILVLLLLSVKVIPESLRAWLRLLRLMGSER